MLVLEILVADDIKVSMIAPLVELLGSASEGAKEVAAGALWDFAAGNGSWLLMVVAWRRSWACPRCAVRVLRGFGL